MRDHVVLSRCLSGNNVYPCPCGACKDCTLDSCKQYRQGTPASSSDCLNTKTDERYKHFSSKASEERKHQDKKKKKKKSLESSVIDCLIAYMHACTHTCTHTHTERERDRQTDR